MDKLEIVSKQDERSLTIAIHHEDHTLGNALRQIIMQNPDVEFCGYTIPHPSEPKIHLRIQTSGNTTSLDVLENACEQLDMICEMMIESFEKAVDSNNYELVTELPL